MSNDLTGDFDVVADFAIPAVDRVLAAMHRCERFPHSLSVRVDDNPPAGSKVSRPSIVASVDAFGDATVDHSRLSAVIPLAGASAASSRLSPGLDPVVNPDLLSSYDPPVVPSHLQGRAQLQLGPSTIELGDPSGNTLTLKLGVMARYFPDPHTSPLTEFLRGELQLTAGVDQVVSQQLNMIDVNIKADQIAVVFKQAFPSQPLSAEDSAALTLLIRNALRTGFLPTSNPVPGNIDYLQFKALTGNPDAIAVMLNMASFDPATGRHIDLQENPGDPASVNNNFAVTGDDLALAIGRDFILGSFDPLLNNISTQPLPPIKVHQWPLGDGHYTVIIGQVTPDLQDGSHGNPGKIVLTIAGSAVGDRWWTPNFTFTARLAFTLQANGDTVDLVPEDISDSDVDTTSGLVNSLAKGDIATGIRDARDVALRKRDPNKPNSRDVFGQVNDMLSADKNVGQFLRSLLKPPDQQPGVAPPQDVFFLLWYRSVDIKSSGIILHGSLAVADWPAVHVEFQQIPAATGGGFHGRAGLGQGSDYSALNSWIPGGTIQQYEWAHQGQAQPYIDANRFVLIAPGQVSTSAARVGGGTPATIPPELASTGLVSAYSPLCLTVRGLRYSASGQVVQQPVTSSACGATTVPLVQGDEVKSGGEALMVALTQPGPSGHVEVVGHAAVQRDASGNNTPNRLVHFADDKTASSLGLLLDALRGSERGDAATAVVAVLTADQLAKAMYAPGIIYAEDGTDAWARTFGVKSSQRPLTLIAGPKGGVAWQQEGHLDNGKLAAILAKYLARTGPVARSVPRLSVRIDGPPPNFLCELVPGQRTTLRKVARRPVILHFWKTSSKASLQAALDLQKATRKTAGHGPILLAINDGDAPELAKKVAAESGLTAALVPDPQRNISQAYGVNIWPTTVFIDSPGLVRSIRFGRFSAEPDSWPSESKAAASR